MCCVSYIHMYILWERSLATLYGLTPLYLINVERLESCSIYLEAAFISEEFCIKTFEPPHDKTNKMACAPSEDSDQPGHPPSLISVVSVRIKKACALSYQLGAPGAVARSEVSPLVMQAAPSLIPTSSTFFVETWS